MNDKQTTALVLGIGVAFVLWLNATGRLPFVVMNIKGLGPNTVVPPAGTATYKSTMSNTSINGMNTPSTINNLNFSDVEALGRTSVYG